jgi:hypothetical protein
LTASTPKDSAITGTAITDSADRASEIIDTRLRPR